MRAAPNLRAALLASAIAIAIAGALAGVAAAQAVTTRSGEHADFSRLVLAIPPGAEWSLAPAPGGFELRLPDDAEYDLGGAFEKIPRDRLAALAPLGGGRLRLEVGCDCHAEAFLHRDDLVIDVIDGPPPAGGLGPGPLPGMPPGPQRIGIALPLLAPPRTASLLLPPLAAPAVPESEAAEAAEDHAAHVADTQAAILEGFGRAATQGLLDVAPGDDIAEAAARAAAADAARPAPAAQAEAEVHPPEAHPPETGLPEALPQEAHAEPGHAAEAEAVSAEEALVAALDAAAQPGLALRTSIDRDRPGVVPPLAASGATCLEDAAFDVAAWGAGGPADAGGDFATAVAARAAALSDERDVWRDGAAEDLARAYVAFGFGREAAQALAVDGRRSAERDRLLVLAALVDGDPAPGGALADQAGCTGPVAFWRALARGTIDGTDERERTAMTLALRALPEALRGHLAPRLAGLFLDAGDGDGAREIVELAEGTDAAPATGTRLAAAAVTEELDGPVPAIADLAEIAATDSRVTPEAVLDLIDLTLAEGQAVSEETLILARSLRFEHRGTPAEGALLAAEARALAAASFFVEAMDLIEVEEGLLAPAEAEGLMTAVIEELTRELPDPAFLETALRELPRGLSLAAARPVAARLAAMGFGPESEAWLARATASTAVSASASASSGIPPEEAVEMAPPVTEPPETEGVPVAAPGPAIESDESDPAGIAEPEPGQAEPEPEVVALAAVATLAERQALLDGAAAARARATALLDAGLPAE